MYEAMLKDRKDKVKSILRGTDRNFPALAVSATVERWTHCLGCSYLALQETHALVSCEIGLKRR